MRKSTLLALVGVVCLLVLEHPASASHAQFYILDGFGGVHTGNGAPAISPATPYFGFDIAKGIAYVPSAYGGTSGTAGDGVIVVDGYGGVHYGGALADDGIATTTPYFGFDIARAITYRNIPPRANFTSTDSGNVDVTSTTFVSIASTDLYVPDDGFVLIAGNASVGNTSGNSAYARMAVGVDGTTALDNIEREIGLLDTVGTFRSDVVVQMASVTAGQHTFNLLLRDSGGTGNPTYFDSTIAVIYVDQNDTGISIAAPGSNGPTGDAGR